KRKGNAPRLPPTRDWGAALFIVAVDGNALPHAVEMIRVAARESIDCGAIDGVDDKNAADRRFAVIGDECARGDYVNRVLFRAVEMDAVIAIMLGAGRQNVFLVERVDDEQHALFES